MLLVHDERLLALVDTWLTGVPADAFTDVLPLLRRTFSAYETGVRRTLGELVRRGPAPRANAEAAGSGSGSGIPGFAPDLDTGRADAVLPLLSLLLGLADPGADTGTDSGTGAGAGTGTGTDSGTGADTGTGTSTGISTDTGTGISTGTDIDNDLVRVAP
jgi:hypothetical protein